jgi:hypothetical protein
MLGADWKYYLLSPAEQETVRSRMITGSTWPTGSVLGDMAFNDTRRSMSPPARAPAPSFSPVPSYSAPRAVSSYSGGSGYGSNSAGSSGGAHDIGDVVGSMRPVSSV